MDFTFFKRYRLFFISYFVLLLIGLGIWATTDFGAICLYFQHHSSGVADIIFYLFTAVFEFPYLLITFVIILIWSWRKLVILLSSYIFASIIAQLLKRLFNHPRPVFYFEQQDISIHSYLEQLGGTLPHIYGFPSGHTTVSFALLSMFIFWLPRYTHLPLLLIACLIGISRIYLACHFLEDVLLGSFIGIFSSTVVYLFCTSSYIKRFRLGRLITNKS